jgi:hypothetical protein
VKFYFKLGKLCRAKLFARRCRRATPASDKRGSQQTS